MKVLVVAAHPDDEVLGCGGTLPKLAERGHDTYIAILGEGVTSRYPQREEADLGLVRALAERSREVAAVLGTRDLCRYDLPDNRFDSVPLLDVVKIVEELVGRVGPQVVYTHHPGDLNIDHLVTFRAVMAATRPMVGCPVTSVLCFEVPSSTEWAFQQVWPAFRPNVFVDITATLELKQRSMALYESEARPFPHPRSPEALRVIAQRWGTVAGLLAAEAFELVRSIEP